MQRKISLVFIWQQVRQEEKFHRRAFFLTFLEVDILRNISNTQDSV